MSDCTDPVLAAHRSAHESRGTVVEVLFPAEAPYEVVEEFVDQTADRLYGMERGDWDPFVSSHVPSGFGIWVKTAKDIRELGKRVQESELDKAPIVWLIEWREGHEWSKDWPTIWVVERCAGGHGPVYMGDADSAAWETSSVTDDNLTGHGPWRIVGDQGVKW